MPRACSKEGLVNRGPHNQSIESAEAPRTPHTHKRIRQAALHNLPIPAFRQNARQNKPIQASESELP